jgi:hypothetical protein
LKSPKTTRNKVNNGEGKFERLCLYVKYCSGKYCIFRSNICLSGLKVFHYGIGLFPSHLRQIVLPLIFTENAL